MRLNKKGMTLIEILVVLVISSIIMFIAGSLILNGIGYFNKTASKDVDKQITDQISSLVRDELIYASDVRISTEKPSDDEWHTLSLDKNGYLMKDDMLLYEKGYYNHKSLKLEAYVYSNTYRLDLKFILMDNAIETYKTSMTLELINRKTDIIGTNIYDVRENANYSLVDISYSSKNKIYYQNGKLGITDDADLPPSNDQKGTVADEIQCRNDENTKEWFAGKDYAEGTFVKIDDVWYRSIEEVKNSTDPAENSQGSWKAISLYYHPHSSYKEGDIVEWTRDSDFYYQCKKTFKYQNGVSHYPGDASDQYWKHIDKKDIDEDKYISCKIIADDSKKTVAGEYDRCHVDGVEPTKWEEVSVLHPGDYVIYKGEHYRYISNVVFDSNLDLESIRPDAEVSDDKSRNYWKKIQKEFDKRSAYFKGDIVLDTSDNKYYQVVMAWANDGNPPSLSKDVWNEVNINDNAVQSPKCRTTWW